jgi:hypothetical protein
MILSIQIQEVRFSPRPWCSVAFVDLDGRVVADIANIAVNPKHARNNAEECAAGIVADALRRLIEEG